MTITKTFVIAATLLAACKSDPKPQPSPGSAAPVAAPAPAPAAGSGSAVATPPPPPAPAEFLPAKLAETEGVVFAETKGGTVEVTAADGSKSQLADGTRVKITALGQSDMSDQSPTTDEIEINGKRGRTSAMRVLAESRLQRSPDHKFAVFVAPDQCGDLCHTQLFLVGADGARKPLGDGVVDVIATWHQDGAHAAIGSGTLWLVTLPALEVKPIAGYTSPTFAPDGTLYVRDAGGSAFVLVDGVAKRVWQAPKKKPDPDDYGADQPPPVIFDTAGKPHYELP